MKLQKIIAIFREGDFPVGYAICIIGYTIFGISLINSHSFDYFSKPSSWFVLSVIVTSIGSYIWVKGVSQKRRGRCIADAS